jgi:hypothetical protein
MGVGDKGVRDSIWRDQTDQSKAHPQWAYIGTPLWMSTQILIMKNQDSKMGIACGGGGYY